MTMGTRNALIIAKKSTLMDCILRWPQLGRLKRLVGINNDHLW